MNKVLLLIGGGINLVFALFHVALGQALGAQGVLSCLSPDNRATVYTLNFSVAFTCLAFAYLSLFHWKEMLGRKMGTAVLAVIGAFWVLRAVNQVVFYGLSASDTPLWTVVCLLISLLYVVPIFGKRSASPVAITS
jgi:hypothetical protein